MFSNRLSDNSGLSGALTRSIHHYWGWFLAEGIVLTLLGLGAIMIPMIAGVVATLFLGWLFLIVGVVGLISTFRARHAPGFTWSLLSAILAIVVGLLLVVQPLSGLVTLAIVLTAYFVIDGIFMIFLAISHRRELSGRWEWMLVNGVIDLILAGIVISGMPGTLFWVPGLLIGIDLIFGGGSLIAMALAAHAGRSVE